jgi:hypothetical protein
MSWNAAPSAGGDRVKGSHLPPAACCMPMEYRTVFDIATAGYKGWSFPAFGMLFVAIGAVLVANRRRLRGPWSRIPRARNAFAFFFLGFSVLWTLGVFALTYGQCLSLAGSRASNDALVAEGVVTDFKPMPYTGHSMEKFCVARACFAYSDYVVVAGFNNTASHGGPIHDGLPVRVTYVGNSILKLEVAR